MAEPHSQNDDQTLQLACDLRERVRDLNYATFGPPSLTAPQTIYSILGNLSEAAYGLDQTLTQMGEFLEGELEAERLVSADEDGPEPAVSQARDELAEAIEHAQDLSNALERAQRQIGLLAVQESATPPTAEAKRRDLSAASDSDPADLARAELPAPIGDLLPPPGSPPAPPSPSREPASPSHPRPAP
ncbi:hypothetical protein GCM10009678_72520 [Actinomadura kijaniata]|uniref:Uncharacterized protein n=1 Tax=Actinomadura namibiensis TaxID=182080 RepID=A0A7W3QRB5_ACTNM|nr:hypothetical protein [Actinomadura namibiensis]MBA8956564.1 hypothetical protein [Actinomadura namibiensis]